MAIESKKPFRFKFACTGIGCPARFTCGSYFALNYRDKSENIIRPPFTKHADGKFKDCPQMIPIEV